MYKESQNKIMHHPKFSALNAETDIQRKRGLRLSNVSNFYFTIFLKNTQMAFIFPCRLPRVLWFITEYKLSQSTLWSITYCKDLLHQTQYYGQICLWRIWEVNIEFNFSIVDQSPSGNGSTDKQCKPPFTFCFLFRCFKGVSGKEWQVSPSVF